MGVSFQNRVPCVLNQDIKITIAVSPPHSSHLHGQWSCINMPIIRFGEVPLQVYILGHHLSPLLYLSNNDFRNGNSPSVCLNYISAILCLTILVWQNNNDGYHWSSLNFICNTARCHIPTARLSKAF